MMSDQGLIQKLNPNGMDINKLAHKRECRVCKDALPETTEFFRLRATGTFRTECRKCEQKLHRANMCKKYNTDDYNKAKKCDKYGITIDELELLLKTERCDICEKKLQDSEKRIDHNHTTQEVRGILCGTCNSGIGLLQDNTAILSRAITYLEERGSYLDVPDDLYDIEINY